LAQKYKAQLGLSWEFMNFIIAAKKARPDFVSAFNFIAHKMLYQ